MSSPSLPGLPDFNSPGDAVVDVVDVVAFDISFTLGLIGVTVGDDFEVGVAGVALEEDANPPPETLVSPLGLDPPPFTGHSCFLWAFEPQFQHLAFLSVMPSQLCCHLHCFPARQPASVLNHRHGASIAPPRPLPVAPASIADFLPTTLSPVSMTFNFNGVASVDVVVEDVINTIVSASASKH